MGSFRRCHQRRRRRLTARSANEPVTKEAAPAPSARGLLLAGDGQMVLNPSHQQVTTDTPPKTGDLGMTVTTSRVAIAAAALVMFAGSSSDALAQKKYDTGATDTEIKIGNIMPYSG